MDLFFTIALVSISVFGGFLLCYIWMKARLGSLVEFPENYSHSNEYEPLKLSELLARIRNGEYKPSKTVFVSTHDLGISNGVCWIDMDTVFSNKRVGCHEVPVSLNESEIQVHFDRQCQKNLLRESRIKPRNTADCKMMLDSPIAHKGEKLLVDFVEEGGTGKFFTTNWAFFIDPEGKLFLRNSQTADRQGGGTVQVPILVKQGNVFIEKSKVLALTFNGVSKANAPGIPVVPVQSFA